MKKVHVISIFVFCWVIISIIILQIQSILYGYNTPVEQVFIDLKEESISTISLMDGRESILVPKKSVENFHVLFPFEGGFLKGNSTRTFHWLKHIDAKSHGEYYEFSYDYGNVSRLPLLAPIHLFCDVIPYLSYYRYKYGIWSFKPFDIHKIENPDLLQKLK